MEKWRYECYDSSLLDDDFLISLYSQRTREIYARIISLDINELPVDRIEGKVTGGSINVDGDSAIRRSCSLTLVTENIDINEFYWGIKTKFKLEIGLKNNLTNEYEPDGKFYPDIVWFKGGTYLITSFNTSISTNNCSISLQGKDKMCLLNGDLSGQLFASIDFGTEEYQEKTLSKVNTDFTDSESFMMQEYYYKLKNEDIQDDEQYDTIYQNNQNYLFVQDKNGLFWKNGNKYQKQSNIEKLPKYAIYKLITTPDELFTDIEIEPNDANFITTIQQNIEENKKIFIQKSPTNNTLQNYFIEQTDITQMQQILEQNIALAVNFTNLSNEAYNHLTRAQILKELYQVDYEYSVVKIPLEKIIREAVHTYAKEPYHNIIINDLDNYGLEQLTYKGDQTLYALRNRQTLHFSNVTLNISKFPEVSGWNESDFDTLVDEITSEQGNQLKTIQIKGIDYSIAKIEYGDDLGYRITDLTYTGDLISSIGEALTSILDKIKTMLGNFEYFYDVDGRFIFQEKKNYVNSSWSQLTKTDDETYMTYSNDPTNKKIAFNFEGNILLTAINNTPVLNNVKNDYSVWGKRKGISGADIPIHARYAIDKKPKRYEAFNGIVYVTAAAGEADRKYDENDKEISVEVDWRELIYQMAKDYFLGQGCSASQPIYDLDGNLVIDEPDHFLSAVAERNPNYYSTGITGYEQYYTDMEGFWRQLYNPEYLPQLTYTKGSYENSVEKVSSSNYYTTVKKWNDAYVSDITIDYYFSNILANECGIAAEVNNCGNSEIQSLYTTYGRNNTDSQLYWNIAVFEAPETLNFWIEFLDSESELAQFSVPVIGTRSKTVNEDKAGAIFFRQIPDLILVDRDNPEKAFEMRQAILEQSGYTFIYLPKGFSQYLTISYRSMSVKDKIDQLLYQFGYCAENISITSLPIYNLQPNTRIYVQDDTTKINGEYIVTKLIVPLTYNGTMSITANKAPERLY